MGLDQDEERENNLIRRKLFGAVGKHKSKLFKKNGVGFESKVENGAKIKGRWGNTSLELARSWSV